MFKYLNHILTLISDHYSCLKLLISPKYSSIYQSSEWLNFYKGKKVVLIGPAESYNSELQSALEKCDIIALVNKGYRTGDFELYKSTRKKIVLFHCLDETEIGGCGSIDNFDLFSKEIKDVFYPLNEKRFAKNVLSFTRSHISEFNLYWINKTLYKTLKKGILGYVPNTGFAALFGIHQSDCEWIYVHGLTFHRTAYLPEYGNNGEDLRRNIEFIEHAGNHNPDMDWKFFLRLHETGRILTSPLLTEVMKLPYQQLFYLK